MGADHGGGKVVGPKPVLNGAEVSAALEQVGGEGMAKGVDADGLRQTGAANGHRDGIFADAGVHMMAPGDTGMRVYRDVPGGEDILPHPVLGCI
jgi:hypothetical protein